MGNWASNLGTATAAPRRIDRYRIVRRVAVGGMAELFLAVAHGAGGFRKPVAIKRILPQLAAEPDFVKMFFAEARLVASLDHPNVVKVLDFGQEDGLPYIVLEYVHGADLHRFLRHLGKALPLEVAIAVARAVAEGLHAAHEHVSLDDGRPLGLVHRDISPSNVLLGFGGAVKLADFGIAKATAATQATMTNALKGKIAYMSPEQCRSDELDRRSDIYSLGLVLYEMSVGRRMHRAPSELALLPRVADGVFTPPSSVVPDFDADLEAILTRALDPDPGQRYPTARAVADALDTLAARKGLTASPAKLADFVDAKMPEDSAARPDIAGAMTVPGPSTRRTATAPGRRRLRAAGLIAAGVMVGGILPATLLALGREPAPGPTAADAPASPRDAQPAPAIAPTTVPDPPQEPEIEPAPAPEPAPAAAARPDPPRRTNKRRRKRPRNKRTSTKPLPAEFVLPSER